MSGFEPPTGRRSHIDQGFVPPNRQQQIPRPPIKHFSSGNPQENATVAAPPQLQQSSGGSSFFSFRKRSNPPAPSPVAEASSSSASSGQPAHQNGSQTSVGIAPPHPRRLSSRELAPVGSSGAMSSANTSSSHEVMLVDPYSMPREAPETKPTSNLVPTSPSPSSTSPQQKPTHASKPSSSSVASAATTATARPRPLHPELRSLISLNAARK